MITIMQSVDTERIRDVLTHPSIFPHVTDDGSPAPSEYAPPIGDGIYWLEPLNGCAPMGFFLYVMLNSIEAEVHTAILPEHRGAAALEAARAGLRWMVGNTPCRKVITRVPAPNRLAYRFARRVGLTDEGTDRASILKGGVLHDQHVLGITEDEICRL